MARQSFLWTILPNGLTLREKALRVSVMISPRLESGGSAQLSDFPDWLDWPATLAGAKFSIGYGATTVAVPMSRTAGANRVDTSLGRADSLVWAALFKPDLFVRGFAYEDLSKVKVLSYDTVAVTALVKQLYGTLAAGGDRMPTVSEVLDDPVWRSVIGAVAAVDETLAHQDTGGGTLDAFRLGWLGQEPLQQTLGHVQLFHTPPSTPVVAPPLPRLDDKRIETTPLEYAKTPLPAREDVAKRLDFHQVIAAMNAYPTLLRRLGLVVDLVLERKAFTKSADAELSVSVSFPPGALSTHTAAAAPSIHAALSDRDFAAVSDPLLAADGLRVRDRLLQLDPERFALLQMDVDGAGLKLLNFARTLNRLGQDDERFDPVTRHEKEIGAPALRTAGLMLVQRRRSNMLEAKFAGNKTMNDLAQRVFDGERGVAPQALWAEDVMRGFRYDIWDATTGVWRSLCEREATYEVGPRVTVTPEDGKEEGTVRLGATKSSDPKANTDLLWLHEALVSWTGWSLVAPPPGRAIVRKDNADGGEETIGSNEAELPPGVDFRPTFHALRGSLPRLRFGRSYRIRARVVDLAGNSLPPQAEDFGPETPERQAEPYLRYEPVAAPAIALVKHADGRVDRPAEGESMHLMAIRSFNDVRADNAIASTQRARRFAVPPQSSAKDAEQHGMLDTAGKVDSATFNLLANKDHDARDPGASLVEELVPGPARGPLDPPPSDAKFAAYRLGRPLTYLPDPLAEAVAVRIFGHPKVDENEVLTIPLYPSGRWPEAQPFIVEALEDPGAAPRYDPKKRILSVPVDKAFRVTVRLSMKLSCSALHDIMGVWRWVEKPTAALELAAVDGQHWMLTPWRTLEIVHAVQRPLIAPAIMSLEIVREGLQETSAVPRFDARCSIKSTDRLDLHAAWHEPSDDRAAGNADVVRGDMAFSLKITTPETYAQFERKERIRRPDHEIVADDVIAVNSSDFFPYTHHEFHDTRYRRIEYRLDATTKFREFLPESALFEGVGVARHATEKNIRVEGSTTVGWVPNSAPPPAPDVLYVVPTFGWSRSHVPGGDASTLRRGGGLRVYLNGPWNVSGYGEMLGVVLLPASFSDDVDTAPAVKPYRTFVTQWGNDPIWKSAFLAGLAPSRANFPLQRTARDPSGAWLPKGALPDEADQPPGPFQITDLGSVDGRVEVAPHDVFYDAQRQLWYCDIEIDQGASYWPFVRLALARYQPVSEGGAHISEVVLADFMPLTADRWLTVRRTAQSRTRAVTVFGFTYQDSSGHVEGRSAHVAPTTVFDIWVDELDATLGEDFGWHRLSDAAVTPAGAAASPTAVRRASTHAATHVVGASPGGFTPASEIIRAREFRRSGNFDQLVAENLVSVFLDVTLWDGTVIVPAGTSPDSRLRLVIAEYEEYIVDDDRLYDPDHAPTKKDRRLVFLEHVELT